MLTNQASDTIFHVPFHFLFAISYHLMIWTVSFYINLYIFEYLRQQLFAFHHSAPLLLQSIRLRQWRCATGNHLVTNTIQLHKCVNAPQVIKHLSSAALRKIFRIICKSFTTLTVPESLPNFTKLYSIWKWLSIEQDAHALYPGGQNQELNCDWKIHIKTFLSDFLICETLKGFSFSFTFTFP